MQFSGTVLAGHFTNPEMFQKNKYIQYIKNSIIETGLQVSSIKE